MEHGEDPQHERLPDGVRPPTGTDAHQGRGDSEQGTQQACVAVRTRNIADQQDCGQSDHGDRQAGEESGAGEGERSGLPECVTKAVRAVTAHGGAG